MQDKVVEEEFPASMESAPPAELGRAMDIVSFSSTNCKLETAQSHRPLCSRVYMLFSRELFLKENMRHYINVMSNERVKLGKKVCIHKDTRILDERRQHDPIHRQILHKKVVCIVFGNRLSHKPR
jgi:hypothetical protein